jgi:hypothetical protein
MTGKPKIICQRTGIELGVGKELSISLAMKITIRMVAGFAEVIDAEETRGGLICSNGSRTTDVCLGSRRSSLF